MHFQLANKLRVGVLALFAVTFAQCGVVRASDDLSETALAIAGEDVAFFGSNVNLKDGWQDLANSRLVQRLQQVPYVQQLIAEGTQQWENPNGPASPVRQTIESPLAKQLLQLGQEMFSDEIFVYGDAKWIDLVQQFVEINNKFSYQLAQDPNSMEEFLQQEMMGIIAQLQVPTTVMGFRVEDVENAMLQLNAMDGLVRMAGFQVQELQPLIQKLQRTDLEEGLVLTLTLDASLVPLDEMSGDEREIAEAVIEALGGRSITLSMGVKDGMLLLAAGEEEGIIESVGTSDSPLLDHAALAMLREAAPSRLRSIAYTSAAFKDAAWRASMENYCQRMTSQISGAIMQETDGEPEMQEWIDEIEQDAKWLDEAIMDSAPEFGASIAWNVATDTGAEGFAYDFSTPSAFENAKPLTVLDHAGSTPLLSLAFKQAADSDQDRAVAEYLLDAIPRHAKKFIATAEQSEDERARVLEAFERSWPLVLEMVDVLDTKIVPSLNRRQSVISLAGKWMVDDFGPNGPPLAGPMPMPELAIACELQNSELFLSGCSDLYAVFDKATDLVRELNPNAIPADYTVPRPKTENIQGGKRFFYEEWTSQVPLAGFNPQVAVTESVVVVGFSQRQVNDMIDSKNTAMLPGWVTPKEGVASVWHLDLAGITAMIRPWAELGILANTGSLDEPLTPEPGPIPTGNDVLEIWDCLISLGKLAGTTKVIEGGVEQHWVWIEQ